MIDILRAQRWMLELDPKFIDTERLENLLGDLGDPELRKRLDVQCICSADYRSEIFLDDDHSQIIIDLTTIELAFSLASGFLRYSSNIEKDPTRLTLLHAMATMSLPYGDEVLTAGFLSEFISERSRLEAAHLPDGLIMDHGRRDDMIAKDAIAAFVLGHEAGHFLYETSDDFRDEQIERVHHSISIALAALDQGTINGAGEKYLSDVLLALENDPLNGSRARDIEELVCDFSAGEAALGAMSKALTETEDVRVAFAAIQSAIAANWVIEAIRDAFQVVVLETESGRGHRNELLAGRSLISAINLAAYRYKGIEGWDRPDDEAINRMLSDVPDSDEMLVKKFNEIWSHSAQVEREYTGAIFSNFSSLSGQHLFESAERILRQGVGNSVL